LLEFGFFLLHLHEQGAYRCRGIEVHQKLTVAISGAVVRHHGRGFVALDVVFAVAIAIAIAVAIAVAGGVFVFERHNIQSRCGRGCGSRCCPCLECQRIGMLLLLLMLLLLVCLFVF